MSSYHNSFKDGPNDKPTKPKPIRTNHSTWTDILKTDGRKRKAQIDKEVKKAE